MLVPTKIPAVSIFSLVSLGSARQSQTPKIRLTTPAVTHRNVCDPLGVECVLLLWV